MNSTSFLEEAAKALGPDAMSALGMSIRPSVDELQTLAQAMLEALSAEGGWGHWFAMNAVLLEALSAEWGWGHWFVVTTLLSEAVLLVVAAQTGFLDGPRDPSWMQSVAREMSLSETAFVRAEGSGYAISWYTPTTEVQLCGHATLAAAHALWEQDRVPAAEPIRFQSRSGPRTGSFAVV